MAEGRDGMKDEAGGGGRSYNDTEAQPKISDLIVGQQEVKALRPGEGCDAVRLGFGKITLSIFQVFLIKHLPVRHKAVKGLF